MRAVLFASATATTSGGRRRRSPITHGSALVAFERSKLALAPLIRSRRKYWLPRLDIPPRRCLPPVEVCRGTRPNQAANSRPLRKPLGSTTVAAMAVAMIGPMPGTLARRWLTGLLLCQAMSCFSIAATAASSCSICAASTCSTWRAKSGSRASPSSRTVAISLPTLRKPCGAITPNSGQMPAQSVHQTRTLAHQPLPATVQQHRCLLVSRLDRHKAHRRPHNRLANCFGIGGIVLIALDVRLHVLRRHQSHLVAKRAQLPRPVVRRRARLQANQTARQSTEERQNLRTPKLLAQNRRSLCIDPVHLKNMLRQVQSEHSNLAHGWLPFAADSITAVWHSDAARGPSTPSFDHLVGDREHARRNCQAERIGGFQIDHELELRRQDNRQITRLLAFEDASGINAGLTVCIGNAGPVAHQAAGRSNFAIRGDRGNS